MKFFISYEEMAKGASIITKLDTVMGDKNLIEQDLAEIPITGMSKQSGPVTITNTGEGYEFAIDEKFTSELFDIYGEIVEEFIPLLLFTKSLFKKFSAKIAALAKKWN